MSWEAFNPAEMDHVGTIQEKGSVSVVNGQKQFTWTNKYTSVKSKRLNPLVGGRGKEREDERQPVSEERDSWLMWKFATDITATMRYVVNGENHYIDGVRPYVGSRNLIVIDTVKRDNE